MARGEGYGENCEPEPEEQEHVHDIDLLFSADSPHPIRIECTGCEWVGKVEDAV